MRTIQRDIVGAFIFSNDNHVLLGKNRKGGVYQDQWVIPGGGIDKGETKLEAVKREVMQEVGLDIDGVAVSLIDEVLTGQSKKTLKETGETVLVDMTFYSYKVEYDMPADSIEVRLNDDLGMATWIALDDIAGRSYAPGVEKVLKNLGFLNYSSY